MVEARRQLAAVRQDRPQAARRLCPHDDPQPDLEHLRDRGDRGGLSRSASCATARAQLVSVDLRPVNFDRSQRDTLRLGFDFTKPLKSRRPSQAVADQLRAQFRRGIGGQPGGQAQNAGPPPAGLRPRAARPSRRRRVPRRWRRTGGGGGGFGGGGAFGGGNRGRIQFSLTDTITFVDKVMIRPGVPELDYLHGDAAGSTGGTPRHTVQAQGGWFNNGIGVRASANWRSGTKVDSLTGDNLHFSPLATFDLRLFANPGDIPEVVVKHPWLRGTQVRFEIPTCSTPSPSPRCRRQRAAQLPGRPARPDRAHNRHFDPQIVPPAAELLPHTASARATTGATALRADGLIPLPAKLCFSALQ